MAQNTQGASAPVGTFRNSSLNSDERKISSGADGLPVDEMIVVCIPNISISEYRGTRSALESEGVIPAKFTWPEGFDRVDWEDDQAGYWLMRARPEGANGPRKLFATIDWWALRIEPHSRKLQQVRNIEIKRKELEDAIFRASTKFEQQCERFYASKDDAKFQAFKALVPGLAQVSRRRIEER